MSERECLTLGIQTHKLPANVLYPFVKVVIFVLLLIVGQVNLKLSYWTTVIQFHRGLTLLNCSLLHLGQERLTQKPVLITVSLTQVSRCGVVGDALLRRQPMVRAHSDQNNSGPGKHWSYFGDVLNKSYTHSLGAFLFINEGLLSSFGLG